MVWTPPSDAIEVSSSGKQWTPPTDAVETKPTWTPPTDAVETKAAITPSSRFTTPETEDLTKPAFGYYRRQDKPYLEEKQQRVAEEVAKAPGYDRFYEDQELFDKVNKYAIARFGKEGVLKKDETKQEYIGRWASHMRMVNNNMISARDENEWLNTAKQEDKVLAGDLYKAWDETASFLRPQGQKGPRPIVDVLKTLVDVSAPISLGVGTVASKAFLTKAAQTGGKMAAAKTAVGATSLAATPVVEATLGAAANSYDQKIKLNVADARAKEMRKIQQTLSDEDKAALEPEIQALENKVKEGVSGLEMAASGLLSGTVGIIEPAVLMAASKKASAMMGEDLTLDSIRKARQQQTAAGASPSSFTGNKQLDEVTSTTTNTITGEDLLSKQGSPTVIAEMQIKNSIDKQADLIASAVWRQMPEFAPKAGEKTFDAVTRTLEVLDTLPDDVVESALLKENIEIKPFIAQLKLAGLEEDTLTKFAAMYGESTSDAARTLQSKSVISRLLNKLNALDPAAAKEVDALFGKPDPLVASGSYLRSVINKFDKNQITAMTVNVSTMLTNAWGSATNLSLGIAEDGLESAIFRVGKSLGEGLSGKPITGSIKEGISGLTKDALNTYFYMGQVGLSKEVAEKLLENSPALMGKMLVTAAETAKSDLYKPIQILNTPAVIMDSITRRAVFVASVEQSMRRVGLNMYDFIGTDKPVPIEILRKGVDDSLLFTFSKSPTNKAGKAFVDLVEATRPLGTTAFPFPRFLTNMVRWTNQHFNPLLAASGSYDLTRGINMLRKGDDEGLRLIQDGAAELSKVGIGAGLLVGAMSYREKNQDAPWNIFSSNGTTVDIKNLAPLNIPFALADYILKTKNNNAEDFNTKELAEAVLGIKTGLIGTQQVIFDKLRDWAGSNQNDDVSRNKLSVIAGEFFGQYFGRSTVPLNQVSAIIGAYDRNEGLPRDAFVLKEGEEPGFTESFTKQIVKGIPILKQTLPTYQSATRVETPYRDTALMKQLTGLSFVPPKNDIEQEIERLKIQPQAIFSTTGSKTTDAAAKKRMAEFLPYYVNPILSNPIYQKSSKEAQHLELTKILGEAQTDSKKLAVNESINAAYNKKEVPLIEKETFEKLPPKVRRATLSLFEQYTGKEFTESTDFKKYGVALALSKSIKEQPLITPFPEEKATGGVVGFAAGGYLIGKALKKAASEGIEKSSADLLQRMQDMATKKVTGVSDIITKELSIAEQTTKALPAAPVARPAQQAMPVEAPKTVSKEPIPVEPTSTQPDTLKLFDELKTTPDTLQTQFTPYQLQEAEKLLKTSMGSQYQLDKYKADYPAEYLNSLNKKASEITPEPTDIEQVTSFKPKAIEYDDLGNPITPASTSLMEPKVKNTQVMAGDLNVKTPKGVTERKNTLQLIREERMFNFDKIMSNKDIATLPDAEDVAAVVQGDFRVVTGKEFDPNNRKDVAQFVSMSKEYQNRLNVLREKFKDEPPVKLFHGADTTTDNVQGLKTRGFQNPQQHDRYHMELDVGGISFTKDINLNYETGSFGGKDPSKFVYTEMPYADYIFKRINMAPEAYDRKNLNVIAQSLNGSDTVVRPVSLPRTRTFKETEDIFTEADKLIPSAKASGKQVPLYSGEQEVTKRFAGVSKRVTKEEELKAQMYDLGTQLNSPEVAKDAALQKRVAYKAYDSIRSLLNTAAERGLVTSTKTGIGQRYQNFLQDFANVITTGTYPDTKTLLTTDFISNVANALEQAGAKQKVEMLNILNKNLDKIKYGNNESTVKSTEEIRKLTQKFNSGGLVSKR